MISFKLIIILLVPFITANAMLQEDSLSALRKYQVKLSTTTGKTYKGMLMNMTEDSVVVGPSGKSFHYTEIKTLRFQKKGYTGRKMLTGGLIFFAAGGLLGIAITNDDFFRAGGISGGLAFLIVGGIFAPLGVLTGLIIAKSSKNKYFIHSDRKNYLMTRELFMSRLKP